MPKMTLEPDNKAKSSYDFPKLWLEKGERARILCIEPEPDYNFVHTLKAPTIVNGKPVFEPVTDPKTKETKQVMKYDFVGRHICIGQFDKISDKGSDPENCPVCKEAANGDFVKAPERRFAMHVMRYKTQPGNFNLQDPFQIELLVWTFSDNILNQLIDFQTDWQESGGLLKHDLYLGPCQVKMYQKMDINVAPKAAWLDSEESKELTKRIYASNKLEDLTIAIGRKLTRQQIEEDLDRVLNRCAVAFGQAKHEAPATEEVEGQIDVGSILGEDEPTATPASDPAPAVEDKGEPEKQEEPKPSAAPSTSDLDLDLEEFLKL